MTNRIILVICFILFSECIAFGQELDSSVYNESYGYDPLIVKADDFQYRNMSEGDSVFVLNKRYFYSRNIILEADSISGYFIVYSNSGFPMYEVRLTNGIRNGIELVYHSSGKLYTRRTYSMGRFDGFQSEYYDDGNIASDSYYEAGVEELRIKFFDNGNFISLRCSGLCTQSFDRNGLLMSLEYKKQDRLLYEIVIKRGNNGAVLSIERTLIEADSELLLYNKN